MANREPFGIDEWYHCYNRGVDKRKVFLNKNDYARFLLLMFIANASVPAHAFHLKDNHLHAVLTNKTFDRGTLLVEIGAYSLMPNHFHLVLKEIRDGGIALFMQKLLTGYTMYFNKKNERAGALFAGTFKSKHVQNDVYLKLLIPYVHLNCTDLFDPQWQSHPENLMTVENRLTTYPYSSLPEFLEARRPERKILGHSIFGLFKKLPTARQMLEDARSFRLRTEV